MDTFSSGQGMCLNASRWLTTCGMPPFSGGRDEVQVGDRAESGGDPGEAQPRRVPLIALDFSPKQMFRSVI